MRLLFLILIIGLSFSFAQNSISGQVKEEGTSKPLFMVNVFLNGTTIGTTTDDKGFFEIKNIPDGSYELIVSMIGYESEKSNLSFPNNMKRKLRFILKPKNYSLKEIEVVDKFDEEWEDNLERFKESFLGSTSNAEETFILNPQVINFSYDDEGYLNAISNEIIKIRNNALGYLVDIQILDFKWEVNNDQGIYRITTFYKEIDTTAQNIKNSWKENRLRAYKGSDKHFFKALAANKVYDDDFLIAESEPNFEVSEQYKLEYQIRFDDPQIINETIKRIVSPRRFDYKSVYSKKNILTIIYLEPEEDDYSDFKRITRTGPPYQLQTQLSWLEFINGPILIDKNGNYADYALTLRVRGYWAWKRFADKLPYDYVPDV